MEQVYLSCLDCLICQETEHVHYDLEVVVVDILDEQLSLVKSHYYCYFDLNSMLLFKVLHPLRY